MKFTATITPGLLKTLGPRESCEGTLLELFKVTLWPDTATAIPNQSITVLAPEICTVDIKIDDDEVGRDAEVVKYMLHAALCVLFDPEYNSDIEMEINDEL